METKLKEPNMNGTGIFVNTPMSLELEALIRVAAAKLGVPRAEFVRRACIHYIEFSANAKTNGNHSSD